MKKLLFFVILIPCSTAIYGQTIQESSEWIIEKYNLYEPSDNRFPDLIIEDGKLYHLSGIRESLNEVYAFWFSIDIKDIKGIEIKKWHFNSEDEIGKTKIWLYFQPNTSYTKDWGEKEYKRSKYDNMAILLSARFIDEGMAPRMEKALLYLIKAHGGNATVKKEPF